MRLACTLLVAAGCGSSADPRMVLPGGDDTTTHPGEGIDAAPGDGALGDGMGLAGQVCVIADLRVINSGCAQTGADGLTVTLDGNTAMTTDNGSFVIATPNGSGLIWQVSGPGIVTSLVPFSASAVLPAVPLDLYQDVTLANGVIINPGEGSVIVRSLDAVTHQPLSDLTADVMPAATYAPFYDGSTASTWNQNGTGAQGITWIPGVTVGSATVTLQNMAGTQVMAQLPIGDQTITFATATVQ
jgi:hypothetical protein